MRFLSCWLRFHTLWKMKMKEKKTVNLSPAIIVTLLREEDVRFKMKQMKNLKIKKKEQNIRWFWKERNCKSCKKGVIKILVGISRNKKLLSVIKFNAIKVRRICQKILNLSLFTLTIKIMRYFFRSMGSMCLSIFAYWKVWLRTMKEKMHRSDLISISQIAFQH